MPTVRYRRNLCSYTSTIFHLIIYRFPRGPIVGSTSLDEDVLSCPSQAELGSLHREDSMLTWYRGGARTRTRILPVAEAKIVEEDARPLVLNCLL